MAIKKLDPSARFRLICEYDEALIGETPEERKALGTGRKDEDGEEIFNPTRYQQYLDSLDESKLRFVDNEKPSYFQFRCLTNQEMGTIQERYFAFDFKNRKQEFKGSKTEYFAELFKLGVIGMEDESGTARAVGTDEVPYGVMVSIGSAISIYTQLGKHLKK